MSNKQYKLLIIEDDAIVRQFLTMALEKQDVEIQESATGQDGLLKAAQWAPDVVLLDLVLPDMDGLEVAKRLRTWFKSPIIVLSSREQEDIKVAALDAGADDYLTKPVGVAELQARIRVGIRNSRRDDSRPAEQPVFENRGLRVDLVRMKVQLNGNDVRLTPTEFRLLTHLIQNAGRVVRHQELLHNVWGPSYDSETNYLRIYIKHLRDKIEADPSNPSFILNEPGLGYRFAEE